MTQKLDTINFNGQSLTVITGDNGEQLVAMKPICEAIGLSWQGQNDRIKRDEVLNNGIRVIRIPSKGGTQETMCLPLKFINGWLFGIDIARCREEIRPRLTEYKRECYDALAAYWMTGTAQNPRGQLEDHAPSEAAGHTLPTIDVGALLLQGQSSPTIPLPADILQAIDQRAFVLAHEAYSACREHLTRAVAYRCETDKPRRINRARALALVSQCDLNQALAHGYYSRLRMIADLAECAQRTASVLYTELNQFATPNPPAALPG